MGGIVVVGLDRTESMRHGSDTSVVFGKGRSRIRK